MTQASQIPRADRTGTIELAVYTIDPPNRDTFWELHRELFDAIANMPGFRSAVGECALAFANLERGELFGHFKVAESA